MQAQFSFSYHFGYGSFCMKDAKDQLEKSRLIIADIMDVDLKTVDNFPNNFTHTIEFGYRKNLLEVGLQASMYSTGGKISYADYSGKINGTVEMKGVKAAPVLRYYPFKFLEKGSSKMEVFVEVIPGLLFTQLTEEAELILFDEEQSQEKQKGNCTSFTIQPSAGIQYSLNHNWRISLKGGYEIEAYTGYIDINDSKTDTNWGGWRINAGISYYF